MPCVCPAAVRSFSTAVRVAPSRSWSCTGVRPLPLLSPPPSPRACGVVWCGAALRRLHGNHSHSRRKSFLSHLQPCADLLNSHQSHAVYVLEVQVWSIRVRRHAGAHTHAACIAGAHMQVCVRARVGQGGCPHWVQGLRGRQVCNVSPRALPFFAAARYGAAMARCFCWRQPRCCSAPTSHVTACR